MKMENAKTYTDFTDQRDKLIDLVTGEWISMYDLPEINDQLIDLANQAIEAGYGNRVAVERNYTPLQITTYATIEEAVKAYVKAGETGDIYHDEILDIYLLDLSDTDLKEWLAYFGLSLWGSVEQPNDVVAGMINVISNLGIVPEAEEYLGVYRVSVVNVKRVTLEDGE
jgi:hypothetical protein|uniref:Uncharacterized protein n=1 Tax=Phage sp. ctesc4 TaxID=2828008 RepID=A0A8S5TCW3_9VIRU|nr:MAG TPA: hypothetical protein [Phage sp. ctesc4]